MTQDLAWHIIRTAFRCSAELQGLLHLIKKDGSLEDYERYRFSIGSTIDAVNVRLTGNVLSAYPELEKRIESELKEFGHLR